MIVSRCEGVAAGQYTMPSGNDEQFCIRPGAQRTRDEWATSLRVLHERARGIGEALVHFQAGARLAQTPSCYAMAALSR